MVGRISNSTYISILHKYDYNFQGNDVFGEMIPFQFYISTIIIELHDLTFRHGDRFQFYISTIIMSDTYPLMRKKRNFNST